MALAVPAAAQDAVEDESGVVRYRVGLGPQIYPSYVGSDDYDIGPLIDYGRVRGDTPFPFEAPDESFDIALIEADGFSFGPAANWEGTRTADDVGVAVPKIGFSIELGAFAAFEFSDHFRLRSEIRKAVSGHDGWIGVAGADYIARDGDAWLFSIGPRVTWSDDRYHDAWFGITPATAAATGLTAYDPGGGVHALGGTATFHVQLGEHWGVFGYGKYDRLVGEAADSPLVTGFGSRDQFSGGVALTYTFARGGDGD